MPSRQGKDSKSNDSMPAIAVQAENLTKIYEGGTLGLAASSLVGIIGSSSALLVTV
jgi:hypothetical protein